MKKQINIVVLLLLCFALFFEFAYAQDKVTINMEPAGNFYLNESQEFAISTVVPENYETTMVVGDGSINDTSAIEKLEYYEVKDGNWYELPKDTTFGGSGGFELKNATSKFRVTFNKVGEYTVNYSVKTVETGTVIAENSLKIAVTERVEADVKSEEELRSALANSKIKTINVTSDFSVSAKVNITRDVSIKGNSHKITINVDDKNTWGGHYVLQAYRCNVSISDITLTGGNAGVLVNGASVKLIGTIDVSNNGFGGIELAKSGENNPSIDLKEAKLINNSEEYLKPTLWTDPILENVSVTYEGFANTIEVDKGTHMQKQYYLVLNNSVDTIDNQLKKQIEQGVETIKLNSNGQDKISMELLNSLKDKANKTIIIYQENALISFETKNIKAAFTEDLSLKIDVEKEMPFESDILKNTKGKQLFIVLSYHGKLPQNTEIRVNIGDFDAGKNPYLYYYNKEIDNLELISEKVEITEDNWASIVLNHSSTYILSTEKIEDVDSNLGIVNPNTADPYMLISIGLGIIAIVGFAYVIRLKTEK